MFQKASALTFKGIVDGMRISHEKMMSSFTKIEFPWGMRKENEV